MANHTHFYVGTYIIAPILEDKSISNLHRCSNLSCSNFLGLDEALKICPKCSSSAETEHKINYINEHVSLKDFESKVSKEQLSTLLFCYKISNIKSFIKEIQETSKPNIWVFKKPIGVHYYSNNNCSTIKEIKSSTIDLTLKETEEYLQTFKNIFKQIFGVDLIISFGIIQHND